MQLLRDFAKTIYSGTLLPYQKDAYQQRTHPPRKRIGALIAMAMVMIQSSEVSDSRVGAFRRQLEKIIANKHADTVTKIGAILATGILEGGGRNLAVKLVSKTKRDKMTAVLGLAVFSQLESTMT